MNGKTEKEFWIVCGVLLLAASLLLVVGGCLDKLACLILGAGLMAILVWLIWQKLRGIWGKTRDSRKKGTPAAVSAREPVFAVPGGAERTSLKRSAAYAKLWGTDKRVQMLKDLYDDDTCRLSAARKAENDSASIARMEQARREIGEQSREAGRKRVLAVPGPEEIWQNLCIGRADVKKTPSGVLAVTLPVAWKKPFCPEVPEDTRMVADGTLTCEIWYEDVFVGGVTIPLPLMGIPVDMTGELVLEGLCGRSTGAGDGYTVRMRHWQNLWIMEA